MMEVCEYVIMYVASTAHSFLRGKGLKPFLRGVVSCVLCLPFVVCWILAALLFFVFVFVGCLVVLVLVGPFKASVLYSEMLYAEYS